MSPIELPAAAAAALAAPDAFDRAGERGQGMVEYAFILELVALVVIVSLMVLGHTTSNLYSNVSSGLGN